MCERRSGDGGEEHWLTQDTENIWAPDKGRGKNSPPKEFSTGRKPGAKAFRRSGVTGTAEGSRYYGAGHPRHSYLGRVCNSQQKGKEGKLQPGRRHSSVDLGKRSTPTPSSARLRSCIWMVASQSHFVLAQVAIPMGSMMIRVRLTQASATQHYLSLTVLPALEQLSTSSCFSRGGAGRGGAGPELRTK